MTRSHDENFLPSMSVPSKSFNEENEFPPIPPPLPIGTQKNDEKSPDHNNQNQFSIPLHPHLNINPPPQGRPVRIYCDGIYDLFHFGHARALEQAKIAFPDVYLLVGVCNDELTHSKKGKTVLTDKERAESIRHCKWVDEVIENAPWVIDQEFLDLYQIDYVAHDDIPYQSNDSEDVYAFVKNQGKFLPTKRAEGVSTSDLITRIVRDYDAYLRRNLERGISAKELNISFLKEQELKAIKSVGEIRETIKQNWSGTRDGIRSEFDELSQEIKDTFVTWEERSAEFVRGFAALFGAEAVVNKLLEKLSISPPSSIKDSDDEEEKN